ncbi:MAG: cysteine desulfurase, partial [Firmicutes bacterium]|nr:cysteine desulfurase [Bacillota bacterium]
MNLYFDHNATTPPSPAVMEAMEKALRESWGNPSSVHAQGQQARRVLDRARERVAAFLGAEADEILFTSGGTEANNHALRGAAAWKPEGALVVGAIEHSSVLEPCEALAQEGRTVRRLEVDSQGRVQVDSEALQGPLAVVSVMRCNHDVGTLQPVAEVAAFAKTRGAMVHTDAVQAAGKVALNVKALGVDLLSLSAHKFHGPKGVGALYVRRGLALPPLLLGGPQERRWRAGTENVPAIAGMAVACEEAANHLEQRTLRLRSLRDLLERAVLETVPGAHIHAAEAERAPHTSMILFEGVRAEDLLLNLDLEGIAVSMGAACHSESRKPNPVLLA